MTKNILSHILMRGISIIEFYNYDSERIYNDAEKALEYEIDGKKLRDIIKEIKIIDRSF